MSSSKGVAACAGAISSKLLLARQPPGRSLRAVDPDDAAALAEALVRLLSDRGLAERLGAAARRTGEEWGVTPAEYAAKVRALVDGVLRLT